MQIKIEKIDAALIDTKAFTVRSWQSNEVPVIIDEQNRCIFGHGFVEKRCVGEIEVLRVTDIDPETLNLAMHSAGKFAKWDYTNIPWEKGPQFGYPNVILNIHKGFEKWKAANGANEEELF